MTAEIAIVNRQAIVLAADSAVTIGRERVWKHTNKLFSLGPGNDIAIMIYNNGEFAGFPWELIVKIFRAERLERVYKTVRECANDFMTYLEDVRFSPDELNQVIYLSLLTRPIEKIQENIQKKGPKSSSEFNTVALAECDVFSKSLNGLPELANAPSLKVFRKKYEITIKAFANEIFQRRISKALANALLLTVYEFIRRAAASAYYSGVVIAGYGKEQFFPEIVECHVDGRDTLFVRRWVEREIDTNAPNKRKTLIMPFGQTDIFHLFMEGISPSYITFLAVLLENILGNKSKEIVKNYVADVDKVVEVGRQRIDNKKIVEKFLKEFKDYRHEEIVQPILDVVRALPKEEMADMAHALVELTSLRPRFESHGTGSRLRFG